MDVSLPVFIDTNVLIGATVAALSTHDNAFAALRQLRLARCELWLSRQVLREYMVNVTRSQTYMNPLPPLTVVRRIHYFEHNFRIAEDSPAVTVHLLNLIETISVGGKQIHDANIVATMQTYGIRQLLTFNGIDFARFTPHLEVFTPPISL